MNQLSFGTTEKTIEGTYLWTKQLILSKVGQEEIFEHYLGIPVSYRGLFRSPLREDEHPTCSFTWRKGTLLFRDWSESKAKDCFNIVQELHSCDFYTALEIIAKDFKLTSKEPREGKDYQSGLSQENYKRSKNNEKSIIEVKRQPFTSIDKRYFKSYHLTKNLVDYYNVYGIKAVWLNGNRMYVYSKDKPAIGYYFGTDNRGRQKWKIYFYQTKDSWRFIGNTNRINGWIQLPDTGKTLVITKSLKDVICLARFGIPSIAMQAETQIPYDYIIEELEQRFDTIYTLLDFDKTGRRAAWTIKKLYNIPPLFLTNGDFSTKNFGFKDFSDYLKGRGIENTEKLIQWTRKRLNRTDKLPFIK